MKNFLCWILENESWGCKVGRIHEAKIAIKEKTTGELQSLMIKVWYESFAQQYFVTINTVFMVVRVDRKLHG